MASSPRVTSQANQVWALLLMSSCRKLRYHSNVIAAWPVVGTATALFQKPSRDAPPSVQPVPVSFSQPAVTHSKPRNSRIGSQTRPARVLLNR